jgi:hypothetical protein
MPWVPAIAESTMRRFHLHTNSFAVWAIQQPIPPMYSFANRTEIRTVPPAEQERQAEDGQHGKGWIGGRMINHFPTREFTFANARLRYLRQRKPRWYRLRSTYRGQHVESLYRLQPAAGGGWKVTLQEAMTVREERGS